MKTKILIILGSIMLCLMLATVIVLASLQTNNGLELAAPSKINVYNSNMTATKTYSSENEEYIKVMEYYNGMTEESILKQILSNKYLTDKPNEKTSEVAWSEYNKTTGVYVEFVFDKIQKLTVIRDDNTRKVNISALIFRIDNTNAFTEILVYYRTGTTYETKDEDEETRYPVAIIANTNKLFDYINGLL